MSKRTALVQELQNRTKVLSTTIDIDIICSEIRWIVIALQADHPSVFQTVAKCINQLQAPALSLRLHKHMPNPDQRTTDLRVNGIYAVCDVDCARTIPTADCVGDGEVR